MSVVSLAINLPTTISYFQPRFAPVPDLIKWRLEIVRFQEQIEFHSIGAHFRFAKNELVLATFRTCILRLE